jgi:hypothetical protein
VDTYPPADLEKLGIRNATDLTTFCHRRLAEPRNLNIANGGDGTVQFNLRGLLPKKPSCWLTENVSPLVH